MSASWPKFDDDEIQAVTDVLRSGNTNYWTGKQCHDFENEFAALCGAEYAVALANGTVALELALESMGIGNGDEVIVTPRSFIASASCAVRRGARPVFADVDPDSQNITAETVNDVLTRKTRAIIAVHHAGWPCDMDEIMSLAKKHGILVLEDSAHAHGATYKEKSVGGLGDVAAFSFCQDKIISTGGEGGMLVTNDREIWNRTWSLKDHGKSHEAVFETDHPIGFRWLNESVGTNGRMTEMQAAIGRVQIKKLARWREQRSLNAHRIADTLRQFHAIRVPEVPPHIRHAYYRFYAFVVPGALANGWTRDRILEDLGQQNVECGVGSCPEIYWEKAFDNDNLRPARPLPVAQELGETCLAFPVHPTLSEQDLDVICASLEKTLKKANR